MNDYFELFLFGIAMIFVTMPVFAALDKADDVHEGVMMGTLILAMVGAGAISQPPKRAMLPTHGAKGKRSRLYWGRGVRRAGRFLQLRRAEGGITHD